ncbi:MAG: glycyl-radical enzyme activating protein [Coriobacteriales bacterium]|jgi:pyruvate formate lyase activating enzyme|nr:glycyl-radical enzyme activating protein [Coriobacteriales bacterium]
MVNIDTRGLTYDVQGFTVQDGPGIRTTVFLKGCPLRCLWCHSPESQRFDPQISYMKMRCVGIDECGLCLAPEVCPQAAIKAGEWVDKPAEPGVQIQLPELDRGKCDDCGLCAEKCPTEALFMAGEEWSVDRLVERLLKDKTFFEHSGGGVTISGGEPLSQHDFTLAVLKRLHEEGIHTALDTTGFAKWEVLAESVPYTNLYLYDLKNMDSKQHEQGTGVPNQLILENLEKLGQACADFNRKSIGDYSSAAVAAADPRQVAQIQVRVPVIPNYNDNPANFEVMAKFCQKLQANGALKIIQLLPYHNLGVAKHERILTQGQILEAPNMDDSHVEPLAEILRQAGLPVQLH